MSDSSPKTYTLLITLHGRAPADAQALADRVAADLEVGTAAGAPYESAVVDAFEGDVTDWRKLRTTAESQRWARAQMRHNEKLTSRPPMNE